MPTTRRDGRSHGVDVWDSVEAYQQFVHSTLVPAMGKVAGARGLDPSNVGAPEETITEVHRFVAERGPRARTSGGTISSDCLSATLSHRNAAPRVRPARHGRYGQLSAQPVVANPDRPHESSNQHRR